MNRTWILAALLLLFFGSEKAYAQKDILLEHNIIELNNAKFYFENELFQKCYDLTEVIIDDDFRSMRRDLTMETQNVFLYYNVVSALKLDVPFTQNKIEDLLLKKDLPQYYFDRICFFAGQNYFKRGEYSRSIAYFIRAGVLNLTVPELMEKRFSLGYAYFLEKDFNDARLQFAAVKDVENEFNSDANYYYGLIAFGEGDYISAIRSFRKIENHPKYRYVIPYYIAEIYYYNDELDQCIKYAQTNLQEDSAQFKENYYALIAQAYFEKGDYNATIQNFGSAMNLGYHMMPNQKYTLGYSYYITSNVDSAIYYFKPLSEHEDSVGQNAMYLLADCYLQKGDIASASNAFNYCKELPFNKTISENSHFNYIKTNYALGQYHEALRNIESFDAKYPRSDYENEKNVIAARIFLSNNNFEKGWAILAKDSNTTNPDIAILIQKLALQNGKSNLNQNNIPSALSFLSYCERHPKLAKVTQESRLWLGETHARLGDYDQAKNYSLEYLKKLSIADRVNLYTSIARYNLSLAYLMQSEPDSCIYFAKANIDNTSSADDYHIKDMSAARIADAYFMKNDYAEAEKWYNQAQRGQSENYYIQYQKTKVIGLKYGDEREVEQLKLISSNESNPYRFQALFDLGDVYFDQADYRTANSYYEKCIEENYKANEALYKLGLSNEYSKNYPEALSVYKQLVSDYPSSDEAKLAQNQIQQIYVQRGDAKGLEDYLSESGNSSNVNSTLDSSTYYIASNYFIEENYKQAIPAYISYLDKYPNGAFAESSCYYLGYSYYSIGNYNEALQTYDNCEPKRNSEYYDNIYLARADLYHYITHDSASAIRCLDSVFYNSTNPVNKSNAGTLLLNDYFSLGADNSFLSFYDDFIDFSKSSAAIEKEQLQIHQAQRAILSGAYASTDRMLDPIIATQMSPYADEAIYLKGYTLLKQNKLNEAEKYMLEAIRYNYVSEYWNLRYYLLLSQIFIAEKDNFNAKATLNSLIRDSENEEIKFRAQAILNKITT